VDVELLAVGMEQADQAGAAAVEQSAA